MRRFWTTTKLVLLVMMALIFFMAPVNQAQNQDKDLRYSYRFGCPSEEEYNYCPERYSSLTTDKETYRKGEQVKLILNDLREFEYLVEDIEVYLKPLFEHQYELFYKKEEVGPIPRNGSQWVWTWDQKNAAGEQAEAGRLYIRIKMNCCRHYRTYFRIERVGATGEVPEREAEVVEVPGSPSGLTVNALSPTQIKISWQDNSDNEDGFRIYRNGNKIATVGPNTTSYTDTGLSPGTDYSYRVSAYNSAGESSLSKRFASATRMEVPGSPSGLTVNALSPTRIKVSWQDNSDNEDGFRIYRNGNKIATVGPNTTSYVHKNLSSDTRYCYQVVSYNQGGESESTNRNCTVTLISIPQYPSNLSTDVLHSNRIKVSWQDNSDNEDGFRIYRNGNKIATVGPNTTSYTDTGLSPGTSYSYAVTAFNDSGESGVSSTVDTMTTEAIVEEEEPEPEPEEVPKTEERPLSEVQLLAGIGIVLMVMGYIYSEIG